MQNFSTRSALSFSPLGQTTLVASTGTSSNAALDAAAPNPAQIQVYNGGSTVAFVAFGVDDTVAAVAPVLGTPGDYPVAPGAVIVLTPPDGSTFAASIGGTGNVYFTPGAGL
jgi:hypothetical protein